MTCFRTPFLALVTETFSPKGGVWSARSKSKPLAQTPARGVKTRPGSSRKELQ